MKILLFTLVITTTLYLASSAPTDHIQEYELAMLNKLHKPWFTAAKPSEYPRKGEYPCKGGVCKTKVMTDCDDCQYAMPLKL